MSKYSSNAYYVKKNKPLLFSFLEKGVSLSIAWDAVK